MTRFLILVALILGTHATAQTIDVRTLTLRPGELPEVYLKVGEEYQQLSFSAVQPTESVRALQANPLPLYKRGKDAEGKEAYVVARKVKIPSGAKGVLLLGWSSDDKNRYLAIKDDFGSAQFNDWMLINTSKRRISFKCGDKGKSILLKPMATQTHRMKRLRKGKGVAITAWTRIEGESKLFFSTYWPVYPEKRLIVLFVDDGRKIHVKRISDKLMQVVKKPGSP